MTRYEQGFMNKCAEYGVDAETASVLMRKQAGRVSPEIMDALRYLHRYGGTTAKGRTAMQRLIPFFKTNAKAAKRSAARTGMLQRHISRSSGIRPGMSDAEQQIKSMTWLSNNPNALAIVDKWKSNSVQDEVARISRDVKHRFKGPNAYPSYLNGKVKWGDRRIIVGEPTYSIDERFEGARKAADRIKQELGSIGSAPHTV